MTTFRVPPFATGGSRAALRGERRRSSGVIYLPRPLPHQRPILDDPARFKIASCGRRFGKSVLGRIACVAGHGPARERRGALQGGQIWWIAPTYGVASMIWRDLKESLRDAWVEKNEVERRIVLPGGGSVTVKSADNPAFLRGPRLDGVVIDEAAFISEEVWSAVLRPALADAGGWALFISTPNGLNWFWTLFEAAAGRPGSWSRWQRPTSDNPLIPREEIEEARTTLLPIVFRQEWLAEFVSRAGAEIMPAWFRYYRTAEDCYVLRVPVEREPGLRFEQVRLPLDAGRRFGTVDLAASEKTSGDYFVLGSFMHARETEKRDQALLLLDLLRRRIPGPDQVPAMRDAVERHRLAVVYVEKAGYQLAMVQIARRAGLPVDGIEADRDKLARAQPLFTLLKNGHVYFPEGAPWLPDLERELLGFTGTSADDHDDQVDVLAYAARAVYFRSRPRFSRLTP